jgi:Domain of unknown function (DUF397)
MEDIDQCWRKSSYSGNGGECVEVGTRADHGSVAVRDTKDQQGPVLRFQSDAWRQFVSEINDLTLITQAARRPLCYATLGMSILRHLS